MRKPSQKRELRKEHLKQYREKQRAERLFERTVDKYLEGFKIETDEDYDNFLVRKQEIENQLQYLRNPKYLKYDRILKKYIAKYKEQSEFKNKHALNLLLNRTSDYNYKYYVNSLKNLLRIMCFILKSCTKYHLPSVYFNAELHKNYLDIKDLNRLYETAKDKLT